MDHVDKGWCNLLQRIDGDVLQRGIVADAHEGCGATRSGRKGEAVTTHTRNGGKWAKMATHTPATTQMHTGQRVCR